jgi:hypothetical protein
LILERGINVSDLPIVIPSDRNELSFTVLEGNRRVVVLKLLATPELLNDAPLETASEGFKRLFREMSKQFQLAPIEELLCIVFGSRELADPWVKLRHTGENNGAGIVRWGSREAATYSARLSGKRDLHIQILDLVSDSGLLSPETSANLNRFPVTNLQRLIETPYVREKLGVEVENDQLVTRFNNQQVLRALVQMVEDLSATNFSVNNIRSLEQRKNYVDTIGVDILPNISAPIRATPQPLNEASEPETNIAPESLIEAIPKKRSVAISTARKTLIPRGCVLRIDKAIKINNLYHELRKLNIEVYPNSVAVSFRVFVELSLDNYITRNNVQGNGKAVELRAKLREKLLFTCEHLENQGIMSADELKPVRKAASNETFLAASITTFHAYVHSEHFMPHVNDMKIAWDELQPFIEYIWQ